MTETAAHVMKQKILHRFLIVPLLLNKLQTSESLSKQQRRQRLSVIFFHILRPHTGGAQTGYRA